LLALTAVNVVAVMVLLGAAAEGDESDFVQMMLHFC